MKINDISIKWKILAFVLAGPVLAAVILAWQRVADIRTHAYANIVDKSKSIVMMTEATRDQMAKKMDLGLIKPFEQISPENIVESVPVVTAMRTAAINAERLGYTFRVPKVSPRNPANTPSAEEAEYLRRIEAEGLDELVIYKTDEIRYLKPVRLTKDCLYCHGDPRGTADPTGGIREGWKTGEIHGAFEIITSLKAMNSRIWQAKLNVFLWTAAIIAAVAFMAWLLLQNNLIKPLERATTYVNAISKGDLSGRIKMDGSDEIAVMVANIDAMADQLRRMILKIIASSQTLFKAATELTGTSTDITRGTQSLNERSASVAAAAEEMSSNMNSVAAATEEAATNISVMAGSTEEIAKTIQEISNNTERTQTITAKAVTQSDAVSQRVNELGLAATKIGKVTEAITEISEQTNLLALNATIEAARAGEAGKGFAVVANEIKNLARQTAEATLEIKNQIEGIQNQTKSTVTEIQNISKVIKEINEIVVMVAAAVEEHNVTTNQIAENITQATTGIQEVTRNVAESSTVSNEVARDISQVNQESTMIAGQSKQLNDRAGGLTRLSQELKETISVFKLQQP